VQIACGKDDQDGADEAGDDADLEENVSVFGFAAIEKVKRADGCMTNEPVITAPVMLCMY